jgi:hypothetical protein
MGMLVLMDDPTCDKAPTADEAIRARLIQEGSVRPSVSRNFEEIQRQLASAYHRTPQYLGSVRRVLERMLASYVPQIITLKIPHGALVARAMSIKALANKLSSSIVSRVKKALASPTVKSIGFYSSLKLNGHNAP